MLTILTDVNPGDLGGEQQRVQVDVDDLLLLVFRLHLSLTADHAVCFQPLSWKSDIVIIWICKTKFNKLEQLRKCSIFQKGKKFSNSDMDTVEMVMVDIVIKYDLQMSPILISSRRPF